VGEGGEPVSLMPYYDDGKGIQIYHGDCRDVLPGLRGVDLVLADPPYGTNKSNGSGAWDSGSTKAALSLVWAPVAGDDEPFDPSHILTLQCPTVLWGANHYADKLPPSPSWFVWDKRDGTASDAKADCEAAWTNLGGPMRLYRHLWRGMIKASERDERRKHPTQKPVALMRWCLLRAKLAPGALVVDPYMGSGPVAQACKELGYRYMGIELVEAYCDIAARRLQQEVLELAI